MKKHIVMVLTNSFISDPRVYKEANYLVQKGHTVTVLAWDRESEGLATEIKEGIKIIRFQYKATYGGGIVKQLSSFLKFLFSVKKKIKELKPEFVHFHDLDSAIVTLLMEKNKSQKWVLDLHEQYDRLYKGIKNKIVRELFVKVSKKINHFILVNSTQFEDYYSYLKDKKVTIISNFPEKALFSNINKRKNREFNISFIGAVRDYEALKMLIMAVGNNSKYKINIIGKGVAQNRLKEEFSAVNNLKLIPFFDYKDIIEHYNEANVTFAMYDTSNDNSNLAIPVKVYESVICEIPVIVSKDTAVSEFVNKYGFGVDVEFGNVKQLTHTLEKLTENNWEEYYLMVDKIMQTEIKFSWEEEVKKLDLIYL